VGEIELDFGLQRGTKAAVNQILLTSALSEELSL